VLYPVELRALYQSRGYSANRNLSGRHQARGQTQSQVRADYIAVLCKLNRPLRGARLAFDGTLQNATFCNECTVRPSIGRDDRLDARAATEQWNRLAWTGIATFAVGLLVSPICAALLPFGWDGRVAAIIMKADRWDSGAALMEAQNPADWRTLMAASKLSRE
jgi:Family of unknown function (DUF6118)